MVEFGLTRPLTTNCTGFNFVLVFPIELIYRFLFSTPLHVGEEKEYPSEIEGVLA